MPKSSTPSVIFKYGVGLNHLPSGRFAANGAWLGGAGNGAQPGSLAAQDRHG